MNPLEKTMQQLGKGNKGNLRTMARRKRPVVDGKRHKHVFVGDGSGAADEMFEAANEEDVHKCS